MKPEFRILQQSKDVFIIQKKITRVYFEDFFFWKKKYETQHWRTVDIYGKTLSLDLFLSDFHLFIEYKTLEDAQEWISNYYKYPIINEVK